MNPRDLFIQQFCAAFLAGRCVEEIRIVGAPHRARFRAIKPRGDVNLALKLAAKAWDSIALESSRAALWALGSAQGDV